MTLVTHDLSHSCVICSNSNLSNALFLMYTYLYVDSPGKNKGTAGILQRAFAQEKQ